LYLHSTDPVTIRRSFVSRIQYKDSSGDEIANVNFYALRPGSYSNSLK